MRELQKLKSTCTWFNGGKLVEGDLNQLGTRMLEFCCSSTRKSSSPINLSQSTLDKQVCGRGFGLHYVSLADYL